MDDNRILKAKEEFDHFLRSIPRTDHRWRLRLFRKWMKQWDAPLRSVRLRCDSFRLDGGR